MNKQGDSIAGKNPRYKQYKPEMYSQRMPIFWWIRKKAYVKFILRELTSVVVAAYAIVLIVQVRALSRGPEAYEAFVDILASPLSIILHVVALAVLLFHSITWFNLAPSAMVLKVGNKRIPDAAIITANVMAWIVLSLAMAWLILSL